MKRVDNYTLLRETIIPVHEFIKKLDLKIEPDDLVEISFVSSEEGVTGVMIESMVAHKHEEVLEKTNDSN